MRTRAQHKAAYGGLTSGDFAARTGQSAGQVLNLIRRGWFGLTADGVPEVIDIGLPGCRPTYRIHPTAVDRYLRERGVLVRRSA
jgi:hypothetical protein